MRPCFDLAKQESRNEVSLISLAHINIFCERCHSLFFYSFSFAPFCHLCIARSVMSLFLVLYISLRTFLSFTFVYLSSFFFFSIPLSFYHILIWNVFCFSSFYFFLLLVSFRYYLSLSWALHPLHSEPIWGIVMRKISFYGHFVLLFNEILISFGKEFISGSLNMSQIF